MKIVVTGSLGNISRPLAEGLIKDGHHVTVISSNAEKKAAIEAMGATAAIGSVKDTAFLTETFTGTDAVYTMVPPANYFDHSLDLHAYTTEIGNAFAEAIWNSGVKRLVHLSSVGGHMAEGNGILSSHHMVETILGRLQDVSITFMRPVGFFYNLLGFIPGIKQNGVIAANYGAGDNLVWVSPIDIAAAASEELQTTGEHRKVRYVYSDALTGHETARILGEAIGMLDLKWVLIADEENTRFLEGIGMNPQIAAGLIEMFSAQHNGILTEDFYRHLPAIGKIKTADFAKDFAIAFKQK